MIVLEDQEIQEHGVSMTWPLGEACISFYCTKQKGRQEWAKEEIHEGQPCFRQPGIMIAYPFQPEMSWSHEKPS